MPTLSSEQHVGGCIYDEASKEGYCGLNPNHMPNKQGSENDDPTSNQINKTPSIIDKELDRF